MTTIQDERKAQQELLLEIKKLASEFFTGQDKSARAAGTALMQIESKVTAALITLTSNA